MTTPVQGFACPNCVQAKPVVLHTDLTTGGIRRRRECGCGYRFATVEVVVTAKPSLVRVSTAGRY